MDRLVYALKNAGFVLLLISGVLVLMGITAGVFIGCVYLFGPPGFMVALIVLLCGGAFVASLIDGPDNDYYD